MFSKTNKGESLLNPSKGYLVMMVFYHIRGIDLGFQIDYITTKKIRLFEKYESALQIVLNSMF